MKIHQSTRVAYPILIMLGFCSILSCNQYSNSPHKPNHALHNEEYVVEKILEPMVNEEAQSLRPTALFTKSDVDKFGVLKLSQANPIIALSSEAVVYVLELDSNFVKVVTLTGKEGWVVKSHLKACSPSSWNKEKFLSPKQIGKINTQVDGVDVKVVNLWDTKSARDRIVDKLVSGQEVAILQVQGDYVQLGTVNGKIGWCLTGFVKGL